jgi:hypothetical protein
LKRTELQKHSKILATFFFFCERTPYLLTRPASDTKDPKGNRNYTSVPKKSIYEELRREPRTRLCAAAAAPLRSRRSLVSCGRIHHGREVVGFGLSVPARQRTCRSTYHRAEVAVSHAVTGEGGRPGASQWQQKQRRQHHAPEQAPWLRVDARASVAATAEPEHKTHIEVAAAAAPASPGRPATESAGDRRHTSRQEGIRSKLICRRRHHRRSRSDGRAQI